jgi:hypothetical protein
MGFALQVRNCGGKKAKKECTEAKWALGVSEKRKKAPTFFISSWIFFQEMRHQSWHVMPSGRQSTAEGVI